MFIFWNSPSRHLPSSFSTFRSPSHSHLSWHIEPPSFDKPVTSLLKGVELWWVVMELESNVRFAKFKLKWSYISRLFGSSSGNIWVPLIQQRKLENASKLSLPGRFLLNLSKQCIPPVFLPVDPIEMIEGFENEKIYVIWFNYSV